MSSTDAGDAAPRPPTGECPTCGKPAALCVCAHVAPIDNRVEVLILQHPQEQDKILGTARLTVHHLQRATFRIGLSWPSLEKALGRPADPRHWAILHLGSAPVDTFPPGRDVAVLDRHGAPLADQDAALAGIEGVVLFDGTWSQAKTLWWRNAWVLKGRRVAIRPSTPSLYGKLRKEPRREGLSTLEATALVLSRLEGRPEIEKAMLSTFRRMLQVYRDADRT
jgi:DTW domain-containing protein YfiP